MSQNYGPSGHVVIDPVTGRVSCLAASVAPHTTVTVTSTIEMFYFILYMYFVFTDNPFNATIVHAKSALFYKTLRCQ